MNENYRILLEAAFPSTIVRSWQMLPTSEKLSHSILAVLIAVNETLTMDDRIKYLDVLRDECKNIYLESDLVSLIDNQISMETSLYQEFIKPGPRIIYTNSLVQGVYSSSIDKIIKIAQEYGYENEPFQIKRSYIDAKDYEEDIIAIYNSSGKLLFLESFFNFEPFSFYDKPVIAIGMFVTRQLNQFTINHCVKPGDTVYNILTKETGTVEKILDSYLGIETDNAENPEDLDMWFIPYIEYDI